jgi:hypothetical protein
MVSRERVDVTANESGVALGKKRGKGEGGKESGETERRGEERVSWRKDGNCWAVWVSKYLRRDGVRCTDGIVFLQVAWLNNASARIWTR